MDFLLALAVIWITFFGLYAILPRRWLIHVVEMASLWLPKSTHRE
jgi:hypothetical protein